jgi:DNA polymerase-3 subunit gamma/tau
MSNFLVSARKYRPSTFDRVLGQDSITSTLKSSIKNKQLAQSFLFCGPRGVGKTSLARILAKTINCETLSENLDACNSCVSCTSFNENSSFNIHELDAASNNSVDDIRNLVDQVRFAPQIGEYNIYIIDEVHMLSSQAFNAFLKTLEEPPKHAKFILATTEKHKIIPTILSRCQIFDFKKVSINDIISNLKYVAEKESVSFEDSALHLIAEKSDGALRDSLSLFDRLVSSSEKNLLYKDVIKHLNILDYDYYFKITDELFENNVSELFLIFDEIISNGFDGQHFINGLASHLRNLLLCLDSRTVDILEKSDELKNKYIQQTKKTTASYLVKALKLCNECDVQYNMSNNQRLLVEICLLQISSIGFDSEVKKKSKNFVVSKKVIFSSKETDKVIEKKQIEEDVISPVKVEEIKEKKILKENLVEGNQIVKQANDLVFNDNHKQEKKSSKTISISNLLSENKEEKIQEINVSDLKTNSFSDEELNICWDEMIKILKSKGKSNLAITLGMNTPKILDNFCIEVYLSNSSQIELVHQEKQTIVNILREKLINDKIDLTTVVIKSARNDVAYTNKDKFNKMIETNVHLDSLRDKLGLDPEY